MKEKEKAIRECLLRWYDVHKRTLPWRGTHDPYEIWVSEVMLQQTRTETVERYYARFLKQYPDVRSLADAPEQEVLKLWEGLGYYRRARALREGAQEVAKRYGGRIPHSYESLLNITGIGEYTAGAIASIAWNEPVPAVDGNAVRVFSRLAGYDACVDTARGRRDMQDLAGRFLDPERPGDFNQAVMDLGSGICTPRKPKCTQCPLRKDCSCGSEEKAGMLPIKKEKKKQDVEEWDVLLIRQGNRIAVVQRTEGLLSELWTFPMQKHPAAEMKTEGILDMRETKKAKHVFTHKIWDMHVICLSVTAQFELSPAWRMVTCRELEALPFPSAMRSALEEARKLMGEMP